MKPTSCLWTIAGIASLLALCILVWYYVFVGPYGARQAFMRLVDTDLENYAHDHGGVFPTALEDLYPGYAIPGVELAGLSGNVQDVTNALQRGSPISNLTSWVYVPGFKVTDNPSIAILWESKAGLSAAGKWRAGKSRAVLLLGRACPKRAVF
jgi:hypothetical protein